MALRHSKLARRKVPSGVRPSLLQSLRVASRSPIEREGERRAATLIRSLNELPSPPRFRPGRKIWPTRSLWSDARTAAEAAAAGSMSQSLATNQRKGRITRRRFVNAEANEQAESYNSFASCHPFHHESTSPVVPRWDCGKSTFGIQSEKQCVKTEKSTVDKSARSSTQTVGTLFLLRS